MQKYVTPLLTHWSYIFLALTYRYDVVFDAFCQFIGHIVEFDNTYRPIHHNGIFLFNGISMQFKTPWNQRNVYKNIDQYIL